jgi:hypothetical protein
LAGLEGESLDEAEDLIIIDEPEDVPHISQEIDLENIPEDFPFFLIVLGCGDSRITSVNDEFLEIFLEALEERRFDGPEL